MKFIQEYRDPSAVHTLAAELSRIITRPWTIMEVCGGQTHAILRFGIDQLLPPQLRLIHGPGCPVCVTPAAFIDHAIELASLPEVVICSFGDMLRVPGRSGSLLRAKAAGGDVRVVYSPLDALAIARREPHRQVVFFAIGFETTAPANAMAAYQAAITGVENFSLLVSQVLVGPAMHFILQSPESEVDAFLAAGHAAAVTGVAEIEEISRFHHIPVVVTGFEPVDLMDGILRCVRQLENGTHFLENAYSRAVRPEGNLPAMEMTSRIFEVIDREWRGLGVIPVSGLGLRPEFAALDAVKRFSLKPNDNIAQDEVCLGGQVMLGTLRPDQCPAFGTQCRPEHPLGAPMVSSEGACAAYFLFRGHSDVGQC